MVWFNVSHTDANKLSKEMLSEQDGQLKPTPPDQFVQLQIGETYCKLGRETFKMQTFQPTEKPN